MTHPVSGFPNRPNPDRSEALSWLDKGLWLPTKVLVKWLWLVGSHSEDQLGGCRWGRAMGELPAPARWLHYVPWAYEGWGVAFKKLLRVLLSLNSCAWEEMARPGNSSVGHPGGGEGGKKWVHVAFLWDKLGIYSQRKYPILEPWALQESLNWQDSHTHRSLRILLHPSPLIPSSILCDIKELWPENLHVFGGNGMLVCVAWGLCGAVRWKGSWV